MTLEDIETMIRNYRGMVMSTGREVSMRSTMLVVLDHMKTLINERDRVRLLVKELEELTNGKG